MKEWVEIVRVGPLKPVKEDQCTTSRNTRENLKRGVGRGIRAGLTTYDEDAAIGQNKCRRIPTPGLYDEHDEDRYAPYRDRSTKRTWSASSLAFSSQSLTLVTPGDPSGA